MTADDRMPLPGGDRVQEILRADLIESLRKRDPSMSAADRRAQADKMIEHAHRLAARLRWERLAGEVGRCQRKVIEDRQRGVYRRRRWRELREARAAFSGDETAGAQASGSGPRANGPGPATP